MKKSHWIKFLIGVGIVLAIVAGCGSDKESSGDKNATSEKSVGKTKSYLFVQNAASGTFVPDGNGSYTLTLGRVSPQTIFFSDRPVRNAGQVDMKKYISSGCFRSSNPPNAAIDVMGADKAHDVVIVELFNPKYDADAAKLQYTARIVKDVNHSVESFNTRRDDSIPESFGAVAVFIDDCPDLKVTCGNKDGDAAGNVSCCNCWNWDVMSCDFSKDCCSFERCQRHCTDTYGSEYKYIYTCSLGGWVDNYADWQNAIYSTCAPY